MTERAYRSLAVRSSTHGIVAKLSCESGKTMTRITTDAIHSYTAKESSSLDFLDEYVADNIERLEYQRRPTRGQLVELELLHEFKQKIRQARSV